MAFNISGYVDPGVYIQEEVVPGQVSVVTVPLTVSLVGIGSRNSRATNEALVRGSVSNESLTVSGGVNQRDATLINVADRRSANTTVFRDGAALDISQVTFRQPTITGASNASYNFTANNKLSLSIDGKQPVTIAYVTGADATTISGSLITQALASISNIAAVTPAQVAEGINKALAGAASLGYGGGYGSVATLTGNSVIVTSPSTTSAADLRLFAAFPSGQSQTAAIFGVTVPWQAPTIIRINEASYSALSAYTASYIATNTNIDALANANVQSIIRIGALAGVTTYVENTDYTRSGSNLDWSLDAAAQFTSTIAAATHNISTNDSIILAFDGKPSVTIDLNGMASPPPGYANPVSPAAATPTEIATNINAVMAAHASYGPRYNAVASVNSLRLVLTSPNDGIGSYVQIASPTTVSASSALFGLSSSQMPYSISGTGSRPIAGAIYFASYEYTRPTGDYAVPKQYFSPDDMYADLGFPLSTNQLAIAGSIAFDNGAPSIICSQVNDATFPGSPTQIEIQAALNALSNVSAATDVVVLDTRLAVQVDLLNHVVNMSSPTEKNYRRGWFGMPRGTLIGDRDTPDTYVYRAVRTLQVPSDSPGRGRMILVAPANVSRTIVREDGSQSNVDLNGTYLATAIAARMTAFTSPADTLLRKNITGFVSDGFPTYLKAERAILASNGVTVVTLDAGRLVLLDPLTTEAGGGRLVSFQEISASTQKDAVTTAMTQAVDANLVGIVPSDLAGFTVTIKGLIGGVLRSMIATGAIGPFKTSSGITRDIDFASDIQVFQDRSDPTKYFFRYFYNLRYPAKRFFGIYTVDNPFVGV